MSHRRGCLFTSRWDTCVRGAGSLILFRLLFGEFQDLTNLDGITFEVVQFGNLGVPAAFAELRVGDLPKCVALFDGVRPDGSFGFRRDRLSGDGVVILLHG